METKALVSLFTDMLEQKKREARILLIALICSLFFNLAIVIAFLYYEANMETTVSTTTTTEQDVNGDDGSIVNGDQYNDESQNRGN